MRIIAGKFKSRRITFPRTKRVRPTMDRVRESVFNVLNDDVRDACVLDLFSGCGSLGLEALSRGARSADFVDKNHAAITALKKNIQSLAVSDMTTVYKRDVLTFLRRTAAENREFDLIFMDAPYGSSITKKSLMKIYGFGILARNGNMVVEHSIHDRLPSSKNIGIITHKDFGETRVSFLRRDNLR